MLLSNPEILLVEGDITGSHLTIIITTANIYSMSDPILSPLHV